MPRFDFTDVREATNAELADEIARVTAITATQVERLFPTKADKQRLQELITIVNSAASNNTKLARIRSNFATLGDAVLKLLGTALPR